MHQGNEINPWINCERMMTSALASQTTGLSTWPAYLSVCLPDSLPTCLSADLLACWTGGDAPTDPYLTNTAMKYAADACHKAGMKYSVYNTMRELSDRCTEYFPMLSFNETLVPGGGGGADWLQEHIRTGYLPAWSNPVPAATNSAEVPNPDPLEVCPSTKALLRRGLQSFPGCVRSDTLRLALFCVRRVRSCKTQACV
jgi:hypothetical protein